MLAMLALLMAGAEGQADRLIAEHRRLTSVTVRCPERATADEVVVCGRRRADGFRLPLAVLPEPGDPRHEGVPAERERLQARRNNCEEKSAFLIGCGMAGVSMTTDGRGTRVQTMRQLSP